MRKMTLAHRPNLNLPFICRFFDECSQQHFARTHVGRNSNIHWTSHMMLRMMVCQCLDAVNFITCKWIGLKLKCSLWQNALQLHAICHNIYSHSVSVVAVSKFLWTVGFDRFLAKNLGFGLVLVSWKLVLWFNILAMNGKHLSCTHPIVHSKMTNNAMNILMLRPNL